MSDGGPWTAIILAGQRPGENDFARTLGYPAKALIPVGGEPMLGRVAKTLLTSPSVGRIVVLAQEPSALVGGELDWMATEPRIKLAVSGEGISRSIAAVAGTDLAPWPVLIVTADHALLTTDMIKAFIAGTGDVDAAVAVVERRVVQASYPETRRTWLKFSDGAFTGANLFALRSAQSRSALDIWAQVEKDRKKVRSLLRFFGIVLAVRGLTRTISLQAAIRTAARRGGFTCQAVSLSIPDAAIDVDKLEDLRLAERIVSARAA